MRWLSDCMNRKVGMTKEELCPLKNGNVGGRLVGKGGGGTILLVKRAWNYPE